MSDKIFDAQYKNLNAAQREAVDTIDGPVMVVAGPGTGKTTILTLRIANILRRTDTPANGILAITYTDAGVKAMREKLQKIIGDRAHDVKLHTFHSFASSIISEYPDHFLPISDLKLATDIEQESSIRLILADPKFPEFAALRPAGKPDAYVSGIIRSIDDAKREDMTPEKVREFARSEKKRIENSDDSISTRGATKGKLKADAREAIEKCERTLIFSDIYAEYEKRKLASKRMDYNDLIMYVKDALHKDELLLRLIQERYLYIHVDEHQDTNDSQNILVALIAEFFKTPNIFIVGDEKQAIYRFQGASVENFLLLQKHWPDMKVISLDTNYRSHQGILDASFAMIEKNYEGDEHADLRIRLASGSKQKAEPIDVVTGENTAAIETYLVKQLKGISAENEKVTNGGAQKDQPQAIVAIIVRRNRDLARIIRLLESHGIPVSSERSIDIFGHPVGRLFFNLIEFLIDSTKTDALAKTLVAGMWGLQFEDSAQLIKKLSSGVPAELQNKLPKLSGIRARLLSDNSVGFLIHAAEESGFVKLVATDPSYVHVWRAIVSLAESLAREGSISDPTELIHSMLAYRLSAETHTVKIAVGAPDVPFRAMTAHGSKGLEFDYVFIPYANDESWIGRPRGASFVLPKKHTNSSDVRDVRRLFYVALTRARKHVTVLTSLEESDGKTLSPLRFISELDEKNTAHATLPREGLETLHAKENDNESKNVGSAVGVQKILDAKLVDIAKHTLVEKGLSVTALNHFLECPSKFIYQSILKLPQAPSVPSEKGNAMHEAISRVWKSEQRIEMANSSGKIVANDIEKILTESIRDFFEQSFLPVNEKTSAVKELLDDVPAVAKALEPHFNVAKNNSILTEFFIRNEFEAQTGSGDANTTVRIPIHGKLDALVDDGQDTFVYDYKTRQAMSINAIKGETKSDSDGNYFRQLIYYKILVGGDARWRSRRITPSLVFVKPDDKGRCPIISVPIETADIDRVNAEIKSLVQSVWSGEIATKRCTDPECEWCGLRDV